MKKIKKLFVIIIAVCALFCTAGCSVKDYFETIDSTLNDYMGDTLESGNQESNETETSSSEIEDVESSSPADEDESEDNESDLIMPDNVLDYVALGLEVNQTAMPKFEDCATDSGAIRFLCSVSAELKAEVDKDETKSIGMLVFPLLYFDRVNTENYKYMDWITEFDETGNSLYILSKDFYFYEQLDGSYFIAFSLTNMPYSRVNQAIVAMGVLITTDSDGNETYKYSTYASGDYRTNARSLGYVAAESLNKYALGKESYTADEIELCKTYVNWSVDKANGLTEPTDDNSTYTASIVPTSVTLAVGETAKISVDIAQDVCLPVAYKMYHSGIAMIDDTGKIKGLSSGSTVLAVYIAGVPYMVNVKVAGG